MVVDAGGGGGGGGSSLLGSLTSAWDALTDLGDAAGEYFVSEAEFLEVRNALESAIEDLEANPVKNLPGRVFGTSTAGQYLAYETGRAETHVIEMLGDLTDGLVSYKEAVVNAERQGVESDGDVAEWLTRLARSPRIVDGEKIAEGNRDIEDA